MHLRVLIADDELPIRQWMAFCLRGSGLDCELVGEAENGAQALELFRQTLPDVVITDIVMPLMDGLDFISEARKLGPDCCFVVMTCHEDFRYAYRAIEQSVFRYIVKYQTGEKELIAILRELDEKLTTQRQLAGMAHSYRHLKQERVIRELLESEGGADARQLGLQNSSFVAAALAGPGIRDEDKIAGVCGEWMSAFSLYRDGEQLLVFGNLEESPSRLISLSNLHSFASGLLACGELDVGVSDIFSGAAPLQLAARQAREALDGCFFAGGDKARLYYESPKGVDRALEQAAERLGEAIRQGCEAQFLPLFESLLQAGEHATRCGSQSYREPEQNLLSQLSSYAAAKEVGGGLSQQELRAGLQKESKVQGFNKRSRAAAEALVSRLREEGGADTVAQVKRYVRQNFGAALSLDSIAEAVHLNPSYLSSLFKQKTGENLSTYLTAVRLQEAERLITSTSLRLSEVAKRVGYPNASYFSHIYKKYKGVSPAALRAGPPRE